MSATYNWAYRPAVTNKYNFTVPAGADNVRPAGWCYVALFGNDATGNGSRNYPYRTITKAWLTMPVSTNIVLGSGVYREAAALVSANSVNLIGDGDVKIDISYNKYLNYAASIQPSFYNVTFIGNTVDSYVIGIYTNAGTYMDVNFRGCYITPKINGTSAFTNCIITNFLSQIVMGSTVTVNYTNCTFLNCNFISVNTVGSVSSCIFYTCNIGLYGGVINNNVRYSLFYQCNFVLNAAGAGGLLYPSTPTGYTYYATVAALQAAYNTLYGTPGFTGCAMGDPLFNDITIGDYSLSFVSPAKNLSFFGTYIGAQSIAYPIKASASESTGSFDFSSNVNLTVANDSITLSNPVLKGEIKTKMIINTVGRQLQKFPLYGFNADRNGQYVDSISDLAATVKNPGDTLTVTTPYLVEGYAVTYNGSVYQIGDRLTTVSGQTTFTSAGAGTLREILEAPQRHTVMARFSDGGAAVTAGTALTSGYWYYVISGSITYDAVVYSAGQGFKAVDSNAFSGSGSVQLALSTESFQHYEPGIQPTSNNVGDARTGAIIRGNGDSAYVRGGYGIQEFPINAKFIQLYYIINVSNLKP